MAFKWSQPQKYFLDSANGSPLYRGAEGTFGFVSRAQNVPKTKVDGVKLVEITEAREKNLRAEGGD
jgi:hypothetical protein